MKGKFIVIEGIDGAGKSVQVDRLAQRLNDHEVPIHVTRECSDGPIGQLLRNTYLSGKRKCDERIINQLYAADRLDHITNEEDGMLQFINQGVTVLSDRYLMSSLAYDTYRYVETDEFASAMVSIIQRNKVNMDLMTPDLTIYIDVPVDIALRRIHNGRSSASIYETEDKLTKIKKAYDAAIDILREEYHNKIVKINGVGSVGQITAKCWKAVSDLY